MSTSSSAATGLALAVDIGGTKMAAALIDRSGAILHAHRLSTPTGPGRGGLPNSEALLETVCGAVDHVLHAAGIDPSGLAGGGADPAVCGVLGVASAGPLDRDAGTLSPVNIPGWRNFPLRDRLAGRYGIEVRLLNDAIAVAIGEHWRGAAQGRRNVLGMVVSTGVGGGLIVGGRVAFGASGNAGHIGHVTVDPSGPACVCGGVGCLEVIASGTAIAAWAVAHGYRADRAVGGTTSTVSAVDVAEAARRGHPLALAAFRRAGEAIGQAVAGAVTLLDLDLVVIGGGVAAAGPVLFDPIADAYARFATLPYARAPRIVPARLGGDAGLIGAAAAVLDPAAYWPAARPPIDPPFDRPGGRPPPAPTLED